MTVGCKECSSLNIHAKGLCPTCYYKERNSRKDIKHEKERQEIAAEAIKKVKPAYEPRHLQHMTGREFQRVYDQLIERLGI